MLFGDNFENFFSDINEKALTFINRESYLKRNYLSNTDNEKEMLRNIFQDSILINIRTYDTHSLVLYANDHFNNFVHLYITNSNEVVYLYNYGDEIVNLTIVHNELSSGKSIQVAVIRTEAETTMHVNEKHITVEKGYRLLQEYSNRPWRNPEKGNIHFCVMFYVLNGTHIQVYVAYFFLLYLYTSATENQHIN